MSCRRLLSFRLLNFLISDFWYYLLFATVTTMIESKHVIVLTFCSFAIFFDVYVIW